MTERELQRKCVELARRHGFRVAVTSGRSKNVTRGLPDIFICRRGENNWRAFDFKSETGKPTKEQAELENEKALCIVKSMDDFIGGMF